MQTDCDEIHVLLLKSERTDDPYLKLLSEEGYVGACVPALTFQFINIDKLRDKLQNPQDYSGMIITSQNTVEACNKAVTSCGADLMTVWQTKNNYTVGEATQKKARDDLSLRCRGSETGNAEALVTKICSEMQPELLTTLKFLYPKTSWKTIDLTGNLRNHGWDVDEVEVYCTTPDKDFDDNLQRKFSWLSEQSSCMVYVVFFSPSGVEFCLQKVQSYFSKLSDNLKYIAVGPSTSAELRKCGTDKHLVLAKPNAQSLVDCLQESARTCGSTK